jgi:CRP-like cAMP-binding protein
MGAGWPARSLVGQLPDPLRDAFVRLGAVRVFGRGEVLIAEGAHTTEVYLIVIGFVRVLNHTADGDEAVIAIRTRGDLVGELAALDGQPRTSTVIAAGRTTVRVIDAPLFRAFAHEHARVGDAVARSVVAKLRTATRYRVETGRAAVLTRVARVLEHLVDGHGRMTTDGLRIDVPLPQCDVASLVGTSEKGVSRAYEELRRAGAILVAYRHVTVRDLEQLHRFADGSGAGDRAPAPLVPVS